MTNDERTLSGDQPETATTEVRELGAPLHERLSTAAVESVLDLDEVMNQARLPERSARICLRGDLQAEHDELVEKLSGLVDSSGQLIDDDEATLADGNPAEEINDQLKALQAQMKSSMRTVRFRALTEDKWRAFQTEHQDKNGDVKDHNQSNADLIAATAIAPKMTVAQVVALREKLSPPQYVELADAAFYACTTGGVDIPKSPPFSPSPRRDSSGRN